VRRNSKKDEDKPRLRFTRAPVTAARWLAIGGEGPSFVHQVSQGRGSEAQGFKYPIMYTNEKSSVESAPMDNKINKNKK
jgi:hypothetical protein